MRWLGVLWGNGCCVVSCMFLVVLVVHTTKLPLLGSSLCLLHIVGNRVLNHYILYPTTSCIYLYTLILYLVITISRTFTCSPTRDAVVLYIVVACMFTHYILGTISCTYIFLYHYISYHYILYLSACSPLHLVPPISRGYDVVWYYISYTIITMVFCVSCTTVTTRFSHPFLAHETPLLSCFYSTLVKTYHQ